ncbi:MAG: hypothetical protein IID37_01420 [Planctomycetes bacterium]|nr:hypothetical protein [Planctomycetota bacterium]
MDGAVLLAVLFGTGTLILVAEIFIPSHGLLTVAGLVFLTLGVIKTFQYGTQAGGLAIIACLILLPVMGVLAVKYFHRTPLGRRISPPNPVYTPEDLGANIEALRPLVGTLGRSLSPLHPVGICEFGGRRVQCIAEMGAIDSDACVQATDIRGKELTVRVVEQPEVTA